ncbi:MAG TPA: 2-amino-4-hydroxy-6-hydroxymethyldihydropteridine diphosphokinase [Kiloniellaceae bacterium]
MILVGLGSNLTTAQFPSSDQLLESSIKSLVDKGFIVTNRSSWFRSAPIPVSDQPWFVNGVVTLRTGLAPQALLQALHDIEADYGRLRSTRNASRTLDLDLLAYDDLVVDEPGGLRLPHPRLVERAFVLQPIIEVAPAWRHPVTHLTAAEMLARLPAGQQIERLT